MAAGATLMLDFLRATFEAIEVCRTSAPDGSIKHAKARIDGFIIIVGERTRVTGYSTNVYVPDVDNTLHQIISTRSLLQRNEGCALCTRSPMTPEGVSMWRTRFD